MNETQKAKEIYMTIERLNNIRMVGLDTSRDSNSDRTRTLKTICLGERTSRTCDLFWSGNWKTTEKMEPTRIRHRAVVQNSSTLPETLELEYLRDK